MAPAGRYQVVAYVATEEEAEALVRTLHSLGADTEGIEFIPDDEEDQPK